MKMLWALSYVVLCGLFDSSTSLPYDNATSPNTSSSSRATVHWIGAKPTYQKGTTFGLPWPLGEHYPENIKFTAAVSNHAEKIPLQSWVTGYWPDGSIKWSGHAIPASDFVYENYTITAKHSTTLTKYTDKISSLVVTDTSDGITVDTGKLVVSFPRKGGVLVSEIKTKSGKIVGRAGRLILESQSGVAPDSATRGNSSIQYFNFESNIESVSIANLTSVRALVTVKGKHQAIRNDDHDNWLPFIVRFYLYANSDEIKLVHSLVFDGAAEKDFITGIGIRFGVPLVGVKQYNRHVRIAGVDDGLLSEAVQGITGLRRDPGAAVRTAQHNGSKLPSEDTWDTLVSSRLRWIPTWSDYKLSQLSSDGFTLKKRTKRGQSWIKIPAGSRAGGLAYLGGTQGGLAMGLRDFWKRYPSGIEISDAVSDVGTITIWLYSPEAEPLDLRPFHDGIGQKSYTDELDALEITYEDWEEGFDTPYGIARTSEISISGFETTPPSEIFAGLIEHINNPPVLVADPEYLKKTEAVGTYWSLPDTTSVTSTSIETHLDFLFEFYKQQIDQRRWYGFLDYGDFMHTYDPDRHTWRYDIGGYAWDNSELSPDLFFWLYFLRTGREDVYRFAEALTRHTGEVDVYHIGKWKGLGTRHGVQHFSDSAKQARISQPQYRKYFYFISGGDERVGELLEEALDTDQTYGVLDPQRKVRTDGWVPTLNSTVAIGLGTDWSSLAGGWLIEWERRGSRWEEAKAKLRSTVTGIANLKNGFVSGSGLLDLGNGSLGPPPTDAENNGIVSVSHLSAVFGLLEVVSEVIKYFGDELPGGFNDAWLDYCYYFQATAAEQEARYGVDFGILNLFQGHSRLTAYAAYESGNLTLAKRAWKEFFTTDGFKQSSPWKFRRVNGSDVLVPVDEAAWISTNDVAQYGLAAIQNLALIGDSLSSYIETS